MTNQLPTVILSTTIMSEATGLTIFPFVSSNEIPTQITREHQL